MSLLSSVSSIIGGESAPVKAALIPVGRYSVANVDQKIEFQYFPQSIQDTKSAEYSMKTMPGASHPIRSFVSGGDRSIAFQAVFTRDENPAPQTLGSLLSGGFQVSLTGNKKHTVEIDKVLARLRSYEYPEYQNGLSKAPPLLRLHLPGSGVVSTDPSNPDSFMVVMLSCNITYECFHRNGAIRYVVVDLSFAETVQTSENWQYVGRSELLKQAKLLEDGVSIASLGSGMLRPTAALA